MARVCERGNAVGAVMFRCVRPGEDSTFPRSGVFHEVSLVPESTSGRWRVECRANRKPPAAEDPRSRPPQIVAWLSAWWNESSPRTRCPGLPMATIFLSGFQVMMKMVCVDQVGVMSPLKLKDPNRK